MALGPRIFTKIGMLVPFVYLLDVVRRAVLENTVLKLSEITAISKCSKYADRPSDLYTPHRPSLRQTHRRQLALHRMKLSKKWIKVSNVSKFHYILKL